MISTIMPKLKCYKGTEEELMEFQRRHLTMNQVCSISPIAGYRKRDCKKDSERQRVEEPLFIMWFWEVG